MTTARELYKFVGSDGQSWHWTSADHEYEYLGDTYAPIPIERDEIVHTSDVARSTLSVRVPRTNPLGLLLATGQLDAVVSLTIFDLEDELEPIVVWKGRVAAGRGSGAQIAIECEYILASLNRNGLNPRWLKMCPHALYRRGCNLDPDDWATAATVTVVDGAQLTVPLADLEPDNWYFGGMLRFADTYRLIIGHVGDQITLLGEIPALAADDDVSIYPGCDHTPEKCDQTFDNLLNYGGRPWLPAKNPMGGSSIV